MNGKIGVRNRVIEVLNRKVGVQDGKVGVQNLKFAVQNQADSLNNLNGGAKHPIHCIILNIKTLKKTLVIFAHPYLEHSNSNRELINFYERHQHYTFRDLYELYPDFHIAAFRERKRMYNYDRIIFQFPIIWFGMPPLLRLWIDEVFDRDWLKHPENNPLLNKEVIILVTTGGKEQAFSKDGAYGYTVEEFISGLLASLKVFGANITAMKVVYESHRLTKKEIIKEKQELIELLKD